MDYTKFNNRVAIFGDLHTGDHSDSQKWHQIALNWAHWISAELEKQDIQDVIFLGDFFDSRSEISVATLSVGAQILEIFKKLNIIMIVGNHDSWYKDKTDINSLSIFKGYQNIKVIEVPTILTIQQRECLFLPWGYTETDIKPVDAIFGHLEIESFRMNSYKICEKGLKSRTLINNAAVIFTGHFHLREERLFEKSKIIYTGNTFQMDFGDLDTIKGYYILDFKTWTHTFVENLISPIHHKITLTELLKFDNLTSGAARQYFSNNLIKLIIDKNLSSDNIDVLVRKISLLNPLSLTLDYMIVNPLDTKIQDADLTGIDVSQIIDVFITNYLDGYPQKEINDYCQELYKRCK